jgi:hypothetical protein
MKRMLVLLCGLLVTVIVAELAYGTGQDDKFGPRREAARLVQGAAGQVGPTAESVARWEEVSLARPLFSPGRRPEAGSTAGAGLPRLAGVIAIPGDAIAIFQPSEKGKPVAVRRGETLSGWEVMTVAADGVNLRKAARRVVLMPEFGNAPAGALAKEVKPPPSRWEVAAPTGVLRDRWSNPHLQP